MGVAVYLHIGDATGMAMSGDAFLGQKTCVVGITNIFYPDFAAGVLAPVLRLPAAARPAG